ncbi:unnamed protein product [Phytophthora lilii]|uniref:Unnamed protein product n=1 Tax=Phytophthora lilii TaxID=2077276 RepID=A0A9W6YK90_9STRA|nr:unnamed protein product [Phytophthora lilii]
MGSQQHHGELRLADIGKSRQQTRAASSMTGGQQQDRAPSWIFDYQIVCESIRSSKSSGPKAREPISPYSSVIVDTMLSLFVKPSNSL